MTGTSGVQPRGRARRRQAGRSLSTRRLGLLGAVLLAFAIVVSALAFGAQQPGALVVVATSAAGAALLLRPPRTPNGAWLLLGLAGYTLFQLLPLPVACLRLLSPAALDVWSGAFRLLERPTPAWLPLSVDPGATALEALKWFAYACVLSAASGLHARRGSMPLGLLLLGSAVAVCLVTLVHGVFDAERIYGLYVPPTASRWLRGPFVNGNNLAGYLNLGLFAGAGLWTSSRSTLPSWVFGLGLPMLATGVLLSDSRGGILGLLVGALAFGALLAWRRRVPPRRLGLAAMLLVSAFGVAIALDGPTLWQTLQDHQWQAKVGAWRWSLNLIHDYPLVGVGRGAFESAFEPYRRELASNWTTVYAYAENFPLQWLADWGLPFGGAALLAGGVLALRILPHARRDPLAAGLCAGLVALVTQNFLDLGLELFAVMAAALVAVAGLSGSGSANGETRRPWLRSGIAGVVGVAATAVFVLGTRARPVQIERRRVADAYATWAKGHFSNLAEARAEVELAMLRHPGDAYFPLVGSYLEGVRAMAWIGRALERSPLDGHVHLRLSELLLARGAPDQALLHLRLSALYDVTLRDGALTRAAGLVRNIGDLRRTFPAGVAGGEFLSDVCAKLRDDLRVDCWHEATERDPSAAEPKRRLTAALLASLDAPPSACSAEGKARCASEVEALLAGLEKGPRDFRVVELRARYLALNGELAKAASLLVEGCPASAEGWSCCELSFEVARRSKDLTLLGVAAARYAALACSEPDRCAQAHQLIGRAYMDLGAWGLALGHLFDAADRSPSADRWLDAAESAVHAGADSTARVALERANREGDLNAGQQRRALNVQTALAASLPSRPPEPGLQ